MENVVTTLCLVHKHPHILLGMKKSGFGAGRWNGFGGKVEKGESIENAARRELLEESGLEAKDIKIARILYFKFKDDTAPIETHVFCCTEFKNQPSETKEMKPQWFHINSIPFDEMWPDDREWLPLFLTGKKFEGTYLFKDYDTIIESKLVTR